MKPRSGPPPELLAMAGAGPEPERSGLVWPRLWWKGKRGLVLKGRWTGPNAPELRSSQGPWSCLAPLDRSVDSAWPTLQALWVQGQSAIERQAPRVLLATKGVNPAKSLKKLGLKRVDRFLDRPMSLSLRTGPSFGGLRREMLWMQGARLVCLAPYAERGWQALDLAAVSTDEATLPSAFVPQTPEEARALELALLALALRRWALQGLEPEEVRARFEALRSPPPEQVQVQVLGPDWLDTRPWDGERPADQARRTLHQLDGTWVGGTQCEVRCTPSLRKGRRPVDREPQAQRRRRLFSRWDQGVQVDDVGLLSATPEALALELAQGLRGRVLDGSCGVGAMAIAAARVGCEVVACDLSQARLDMARHNAGLYGVQLTLICQDLRQVLAEQGAFDALILDPPWGGRDYDRQGMTAAELPFPLLEVLAQAPQRVRIKLPRSFVCASLPGDWAWRAAVDARKQLKFLVASR